MTSCVPAWVCITLRPTLRSVLNMSVRPTDSINAPEIGSSTTFVGATTPEPKLYHRCRQFNKLFFGYLPESDTTLRKVNAFVLLDPPGLSGRGLWIRRI